MSELPVVAHDAEELHQSISLTGPGGGQRDAGATVVGTDARATDASSDRTGPPALTGRRSW
jgi:hypothetical protein